MINRLTTTILGAGALFAIGLVPCACTRGGKGGSPGSGDGSTVKVGSPDCYRIAGAQMCPADPTDPSGKKLPRSGGICTLASCQVCGSDKVPAYRDSAGVPQIGWCICVAKSDDSGIAVYSCRGGRDGSQVF